MQASDTGAVVVAGVVVVAKVVAVVTVVVAAVVASASRQRRPKDVLPTGTVFGNAVQLSWQSPQSWLLLVRLQPHRLILFLPTDAARCLKVLRFRKQPLHLPPHPMKEEPVCFPWCLGRETPPFSCLFDPARPHPQMMSLLLQD